MGKQPIITESSDFLRRLPSQQIYAVCVELLAWLIVLPIMFCEEIASRLKTPRQVVFRNAIDCLFGPCDNEPGRIMVMPFGEQVEWCRRTVRSAVYFVQSEYSSTSSTRSFSRCKRSVLL